MKPQQLYYLEKRGLHGKKHYPSFVLSFWPDKETVGDKAWFAMKSEPQHVVWAADKNMQEYAETMLNIGRWTLSQLRDEHMLIQDIFGDHK